MLSTAIASAISNITYPIRHEFARTTPDLPGVDADLDLWGEANTHILVTGLSSREFSDHTPGHDYSTLTGRVVPVRPSRPDGGQWYLSAENNGGNGAYLTGARVNPRLVNGRVYQELRELAGDTQSSPFLLRFNDEDHRDDRANANNPWTIVWAVDGLAHQVDRPRMTPPTAWVEVRWPLSPVATGLATDEDIELILSDETVPEGPVTVRYTGNADTDHTHGKAHVETEGDAAGRVILNPTRVAGEAYLTWHEHTNYYSDHVVVQVALDEELLTPIGYYNRGADGNVYYTDDVFTTFTMSRTNNDPMMWAKVGLVDPPVNAERSSERLTELVERATASHEAFENLNDALNELARAQSWCSEYERTMTGIGMRHRRNGPRQPYDPDNLLTVSTRKAWSVTVDVDMTITDDSISYRVSNMLESEYSVSSASNIRFDASMSVTINGIVADTEEEAEEMVDTNRIVNELDGIVEGEFEVDDWTHSSTEEDEDFDWDEYDD